MDAVSRTVIPTRSCGPRAWKTSPGMPSHTNGAARHQALAPTCGVDWQGGRQRVDRIYASKPLLPAITDVKVIDVDWSDHDVLVATVNTQEFIQILNRTWQLALAA
ncbi:hypothetical protein SANTM175S_05619 [Streptomyces antimycoticus]